MRYASLDSCTRKDEARPCGAWMLTLRNGRTVKLTDAAVFPRTAKGRLDRTSSTPFAVSGDGDRVLYVRASDHKLVWKDVLTGRVRSLPGAAARAPKGLGMSDVDPILSPSGDVVVIDYYDDSGKRPTLAVDLGTGQIGKLPGGDSVQGFSPDGRRILMSGSTSDNTTEFAVYDTNGQPAETREVPQVVSNNSPVALADDGVTIALVIVPPSGRPNLRQYDLSTDAISPAIDLGIAKKESAYRIYWDDSGKLTLWTLLSQKDGDVVRATVGAVNPSTGHFAKADSFRVRDHLWTWWLPGE
ncbi:TolB-like translocation protein [Sphaerisporangium corydalis]|uniref:Lipoprotein LpqB beta-propeller domain-containing protein n=1 Tax=Sphaerisporangium corydalis TaxID=1441875 RepID=A0ABV9EIW1_9ACTN|nr:hypothetical protein [Sphaerisporangium corydalis]